MDELEYRSLLIEMVRTSDYEKKEDLLEILKMCTIRFEKTGDFTRSKWNHYKEYIHVCIVPDKISELEEHFEYLEEVISDIYPPNDEYEFWGAKIKPGIISGIEDVSQEILFKEIRNRIVDEIRDAKYMIWISVAWFTDPVLYEELLKKKQQGLVIEIALNDCQKNRDAEFSLEDSFSVYWIKVKSKYQNYMHEKFCIIDLYTSIHGSFNWTKAANYNKEQISIDKNHSTAVRFADEFMELKNKRNWNT